MFKLKKQYGLVQVTTIEGVAINLGGSDIKKVTPARGESPSVEVVIKGASQAQLKQLYNQGHPLIEEVKDEEVKEAKEIKKGKDKEKEEPILYESFATESFIEEEEETDKEA